MNEDQKKRNASPVAAILRQVIVTLAAQCADETVAMSCEYNIGRYRVSSIRNVAEHEVMIALGVFVACGKDPVGHLRSSSDEWNESCRSHITYVADAIEKSIAEGLEIPDPAAQWAAKVERVRDMLTDAMCERDEDESESCDDHLANETTIETLENVLEILDGKS